MPKEYVHNIGLQGNTFPPLTLLSKPIIIIIIIIIILIVMSPLFDISLYLIDVLHY